ncbi:MAG: BON domain-containing protein [Vicinamibacterales bacterium]
MRGPVKNESEKESIAAKARKIDGVTRVDNQIELAGE